MSKKNIIAEIIKQKARKKIFKLIFWLLQSLFVPMLILIPIVILMYSVNSFVGAFKDTNSLASVDSNINNDVNASLASKDGYNRVVSEYPEETWEALGLSKKSLTVIMEAEDKSIRQDENASVSYRRIRNGKLAKPNPILTFKYGYFNLTYPYKVPWQLMYEFSSMLDDNTSVEKISFLKLIFNTDENEKIKRLKIIGAGLQPIFEYMEQLKNNYKFEELKSGVVKYSDYTYSESIHFTKKGVTTLETEVYTPKPLLKRVETYSKLFDFSYKKVNFNTHESGENYSKSSHGYTWEINEIRITDNSQKLLNLIKDYKILPVDLLLMAENIDKLPDGHETALNLKDVYYTYLYGTQPFLGNGHISYEEFGDYSNTINLGDVVYLEGGIQLPYYNQHEGWGMYGAYSVSETGCGPTSMAMVVAGLTGDKSVTPATIAQWGAAHGTVVAGGGSYWSLFSKVAQNYGLTCTQVNKNSPQTIVNALAAGNPVIVSMGPGNFTTGGHFIALRGITEDGKVLVSDPNSVSKSKPWDLALIINESSKKASNPFFVISK